MVITKRELEEISNDIDFKIERIKMLDETNFYENVEINDLKLEVRCSIDYLRSFVTHKIPRLYIVKNIEE